MSFRSPHVFLNLRYDQARKLAVDDGILPWLVGTESCDVGVGGGLTGMRSRGWASPGDTREWILVSACGGLLTQSPRPI